MVGTNGDRPYYFNQVHSIKEYGVLYTSDLPFAIYLLYFMSLLVPIEVAYKFLMCLFVSLWAIPSFKVSQMLIKNKELALLPVFLMIINPIILEHVYYGNLKNVLGILFAMCSIAFLISWKESKESKKSLFSIGFFVLTAITHTLSFGILVLFVLIFLLLRRSSPSRKSSFVYVVYLLVAVVVIAVFDRYSKIWHLLASPNFSRLYYDQVYFSIVFFVLAFVLIKTLRDGNNVRVFSLTGIILFVLSTITVPTAQYRFVFSTVFFFAFCYPFIKEDCSRFVFWFVPFLSLMGYLWRVTSLV